MVVISFDVLQGVEDSGRIQPLAALLQIKSWPMPAVWGHVPHPGHHDPHKVYGKNPLEAIYSSRKPVSALKPVGAPAQDLTAKPK